MGAVGSGGGGTAISGGKALATLLEDKTVRAIETKGFIKNIVSYIDSSVISSGEYVSKKISKLSDYLESNYPQIHFYGAKTLGAGKIIAEGQLYQLK